MKKSIAQLTLLLILCFSAVSADDIWEPEPEPLTVFTLLDPFSWGDQFHKVLWELELHLPEGILIETDENDGEKIISVRSEDAPEQYDYEFMFTKDTGRLWMISASTFLPDENEAEQLLEEIRDFYGINGMKPLEDEDLPAGAEELPEGSQVNAEGNTVFYTGQDRRDEDLPGYRVFFTAADQTYGKTLPGSIECPEAEEK